MTNILITCYISDLLSDSGNTSAERQMNPCPEGFDDSVMEEEGREWQKEDGGGPYLLFPPGSTDLSLVLLVSLWPSGMDQQLGS